MSHGLTIPPGLSPREHALVVSAYAAALNNAFYLSLALAFSTIIGVVFVGWMKLKGA